MARVVKLSIDGRGHALDAVFIKHLWCTVKYEEVYGEGYGAQIDAHPQLEAILRYHTERRPHSALGNEQPRRHRDVYREPTRLAINQ
jgi:putative transposase